MVKIAHRGDWRFAPENSILAFDAAIKNGADVIELDVRLCSSGEVVVFHDANLKRMTGCNNQLHKMMLTELKQKSFLNFNSQYIPTLREVFSEFHDKIQFNIEIKGFEFVNKKIIREVVNLVEEYKIIDTAWISSFNFLMLSYCKDMSPNIKVGFLFPRVRYIPLLLTEYYKIDMWQPHYSIVTAEYIEVAKKRNKEIYVWTVNDEAEVNRLKDLNVTGIITDDLSLF